MYSLLLIETLCALTYGPLRLRTYETRQLSVPLPIEKHGQKLKIELGVVILLN